MPFCLYINQHTYYSIYWEYIILGTKGRTVIKTSKVIIPTVIMEQKVPVLCKVTSIIETCMWLVHLSYPRGDGYAPTSAGVDMVTLSKVPP